PGTLVWTSLALAVGCALISFVGVLLYRRRAVAHTPGAPDKEETSISVFCSACGAALKVKAALAGKDGQCPKCRAVVHVPIPDAATNQTPATSLPQWGSRKRWGVLAVLTLVVLLVAGAIALKFHRPKRSPMVGVQVGSEFVLHVEESGFFPQ